MGACPVRRRRMHGCCASPVPSGGATACGPAWACAGGVVSSAGLLGALGMAAGAPGPSIHATCPGYLLLRLPPRASRGRHASRHRSGPGRRSRARSTRGGRGGSCAARGAPAGASPPLPVVAISFFKDRSSIPFIQAGRKLTPPKLLLRRLWANFTPPKSLLRGVFAYSYSAA